MKITVTRHHDFSYGHRVVGHEGKCALLHGHNARVHFTVASRKELDAVGRVLDFSIIKSLLCDWVEEHWDHRMLLSLDDPLRGVLAKYPSAGVVVVPFNPTAENMGQYLLDVIGPSQLEDTRCELIEVTVEETRKCRATCSRGMPSG